MRDALCELRLPQRHQSVDEGLGARRVKPGAMEEHGTKWVLMADPDGNEFCVCDAGAGG